MESVGSNQTSRIDAFAQGTVREAPQGRAAREPLGFPVLGASLEEVVAPRARLEVVMLAVARVPSRGGRRSREGGVRLRRRSSGSCPVRLHQRWGGRLPSCYYCGGHFRRLLCGIDIGRRETCISRMCETSYSRVQRVVLDCWIVFLVLEILCPPQRREQVASSASTSYVQEYRKSSEFDSALSLATWVLPGVKISRPITAKRELFLCIH